ncbi:MAG: M28 family peptidase [Hydrogenophilales bacterium]|nr:M28 family peptidase [Hydrogenophilales bacterium]
MNDSLSANLLRHVQMLAGEIGERNVYRPAALDAAARYIEAEFAGIGYSVKRQTYVAQGVESANLEIVLPGQRWPDESIVVGAHYDTVEGSPGADDNASAVAALIEIARLLHGHAPGRTLKLVAFVNEEPPFFFFGEMGSRVYARAARSRQENIRLMISLEMLGYYRDEAGSQAYPPLFRYFHPDCGNFIAFVSNFRSRRVMRRAARAFRDHSDFPLESTAAFGWIPGVAWSDHLSFWREGYRAFMCTDTAFFRNPYYHSAQDTPEKLDYPRLAVLTDALAKMCGTLAGCEDI